MAEFVAVSRVDDIEESELKAFEVRGTRIAVAKADGTFYAFDDTCTHMRCSLAGGDLEGTTVICPCHGSEFDVRSGEVLRGPAREPVETYRTRTESGSLKVEG
jgi:nitrite reductase/ring-hydroxylating ferredoxin subunit